MAASDSSAKKANTVDFQALILGFSSAALYYMGQNVAEDRSRTEKNLPLAKQNIDIILLLKEKTKGNLTAEEAKLIDQALLDLEVKFVEAAK